MKFIIFILTLFSLTSCVELIDDITINSNGTGTLKYTINLSSSRTKVHSILLLDSLDGHRVPKIADIKQKISEFEKIFSSQTGISNVKIETNWDDYILKFSCDFSSLENLQTAFKKTIESMNWTDKTISSGDNWLTWTGKYLQRDLPTVVTDRLVNSAFINEEDLILGKYCSISRFDKEVSSFENKSSLVSKNKKSVMVQTDMKSLLKNPNILDNKIYLSN